MLLCRICVLVATVFSKRTIFGGSQPERGTAVGGVFKAHAVPQGLCENLIDALKLLANQQKDGHSVIQSVVTGLCERSGEGIMEGLRNFIKVDNHCALKVGHTKEGTKSCEVRRPKFEEECSEVSVRKVSRN